MAGLCIMAPLASSIDDILGPACGGSAPDAFPCRFASVNSASESTCRDGGGIYLTESDDNLLSQDDFAILANAALVCILLAVAVKFIRRIFNV